MIAGLNRRLGAAIASLLALAAFATPAMAVGDVVISQVWGGSSTGAGTAALPKSDFVELFNRTANPINLTGWSVTVSASGTSTAYAQVNLTGTIQPFSYYLIQCFTTPATAGIDLPTPDLIYGTAATTLASTTGKVSLRSVTTAVGAVGCPASDATLIDLVTYGTTVTTCREGSANAPAGSATGSGLAVFRAAGGCVDTDQNGADFATAIPSPRNSASPSTGGCTIGACCNNNTGACSGATASGCVSSGGTYRGDGTTCPPTPACPANGACCNGATGGTCTILTSASCAGISGFYQGDGSLCSPTPCVTASCCLPANLTCCTLLPALCTAQGGTVGATGVTCTTAGNCIAQPVNDLCAAAVVVSAGTTYIGNNFAATSTGDGPTVPTETVRSTKGVWFRFTPATTSVFDVSGCGSTFDTTVQIFSIGNCSDASTWSYVGGDDDDCNAGTADGECAANSSAAASVVTGVALIGGQTYYIRLSLYNTSATGGGNYHFTVTDVGGAFGACCIGTTGQCELRSAAGCAINGDVAGTAGVYQGDSTTCSPSPCTLVVGACCFTGGVCAPREASACTGTNVYNGDNTTCFPDPCNTEACCNNTSGACTVRTLGTCTATETGFGLNSICSPSPCPPTGACCNTDCTFACTTTVELACAAPSVWHAATTCSPTNICNTFGAAPSNDSACGAITLSLNTTVVGNLLGATTTNDGLPSSCEVASPGPGVWFKYSVPAGATSYYTVSTCGATFAEALTVLSGDCSDPSSMTIIGCDDDTCVGGATEPVVCGTAASTSSAAVIAAVFLSESTTYYLRVQADATTTVGGSFPLIINTVSAGACCSSTGVCSVQVVTACTGTSVYQGDNTVCNPSPCPPSGSCCNTCTFACTTTLQPTCNTATSVWTQGGTCTAPSTCIQTPAPANDLPCGAITLISGVSQSGTLFSATSVGDGLNSTCEATASKGVWYKFIPGTSGDYSISTCGSTFSTALTVMTGDCADPDAMSHLQCDDDTCVGGASGEPVVCGTATSSTTAAIVPVATLTAGTTYYIRIQVDTATATGAGTFAIVVVPAVSGACCTGDACTDTIQSLCVGIFFSGQTCGGGACAAVGACCNTTTFACALAQASACAGSNQIFSAGISCTTSNPCIVNDACPGPVLPLGQMVFGTTTGATPGAGTAPSCSISGCEDTWWDFTAPFSDTFNFHAIQLNTGQPVISIYPDCSLTGELACLSGGRLTPVTSDITLPFAMTQGQHIKVRISSYACIDGPYTLEVTSTLPPAGVCCRGATCNSTITSAAACTGSLVGGQAAGAFFPTASSTCNTGGSTSSPCCYADYNKVGGITVNDIFDFLGDWFAGSNFANVGGNGGPAALAVQNIFDFLSAWFAGGCS